MDNDEVKAFIGAVAIIITIALGVCAIIYTVQLGDQRYVDKGMIWVPAATVDGHWEVRKQPAEEAKP